MKANKKQLWRSLFPIVLMLCMLLLPNTKADAMVESLVEWDTVSSLQPGCTKVAVYGSFVGEAKAALKRINEIRYEACKEGVWDPRSSSRKLTLDDYKPLKWSSDLEYIARVRAAEASVNLSHTRPNGTGSFTVASRNGVRSCGEVLAWNVSTSMLMGIEFWYTEKSDWVKRTAGVTTGHYTSMIDPSNTYVGLGCFLNPSAEFFNTTCGEFSDEADLNTDMAATVDICKVYLGIQDSVLKNYELVNIYSSTDSSDYKAGDVLDYDIAILADFGNAQAVVFEGSKITWSSSKTSVAKVSSNGAVTICGPGTTEIKASSVAGRKGSVKLQVAGPQKITVEAKITKQYQKDGTFSLNASAKGELSYKSSDKSVATVSKKGIVTIKGCGKTTITVKAAKTGLYNAASRKVVLTVKPKKISITKAVSPKAKTISLKWKQNSTVTGYVIQYSLDSSFTGSSVKSVKINKYNITQKTLENLKKGKKYYIRIRGYKKVTDGYVYSSWSNTVALKTK